MKIQAFFPDFTFRSSKVVIFGSAFVLLALIGMGLLFWSSGCCLWFFMLCLCCLLLIFFAAKRLYSGPSLLLVVRQEQSQSAGVPLQLKVWLDGAPVQVEFKDGATVWQGLYYLWRRSLETAVVIELPQSKRLALFFQGQPSDEGVVLLDTLNHDHLTLDIKLKSSN